MSNAFNCGRKYSAPPFPNLSRSSCRSSQNARSFVRFASQTLRAASKTCSMRGAKPAAASANTDRPDSSLPVSSRWSTSKRRTHSSTAPTGTPPRPAKPPEATSARAAVNTLLAGRAELPKLLVPPRGCGLNATSGICGCPPPRAEAALRPGVPLRLRALGPLFTKPVCCCFPVAACAASGTPSACAKLRPLRGDSSTP